MDDELKNRLDAMAVDAQFELSDGAPAEAVDRCRELIAAWTIEQGPDGERVLTWRGFLGRALVEAGHFEEAEAVLEALVADRKRVDGVEAHSTMVARGNLARAIARGGRPQEAITLAEQLVADRSRVLGLDDPATLDARGHVAHFYYQAGDAETAARLFDDLLTDRLRVLGPDHQAVKDTAANLTVARARGSEAASEMDVLVGRRQTLIDTVGLDAPETLLASGLLAEALWRHGRTDDALALAEDVLECRARVLGPSDPLTRASEILRAQCLQDLGRGDEAIASLIGVLDGCAATGDERSQPAIHALADLLWFLAQRINDRPASADLIGELEARWSTLDQLTATYEQATEIRVMLAEVRQFLDGFPRS